MFDFNREGITFEDQEKNIVLVLFNGNEFEESIEQVEALSSYLKEEYGIRQQVFLGNVVEGLLQMYISYNDAALLLKEPREYGGCHMSGRI